MKIKLILQKMKISWKIVLDKLHNLKIDINCRKKIKRIKQNKVLSHNPLTEREFLIKWKAMESKPSIDFLRLMCTISGINSSLYVPENIQYKWIEPTLNNRLFSAIYNDKNFYDKYLYHFRDLFPVTIIRGIAGVLYTSDYKVINDYSCINFFKQLDDKQTYVLKPSIETGGGEAIFFFTKDNEGIHGNIGSFTWGKIMHLLMHTYKGNFIVQVKLKQLDFFSLFNQTSLNTVRLYVYRSVTDECIHPLHAYIRFGLKGSLVDSSSKNGCTCGVFIDGTLNSFALTKYGDKITNLDVIENYKGKPVPYFEEMKELAKQIAPEFPYHRLLGFDFTVDENQQVRLLEVNNLYIGVINQQMNTGPLYGSFTDEIINYCKNHKKTVNFHYYI